MAPFALQVIGLIFGGLGMIGAFAVAAMPQWRVSAFIGGNIVIFENIWEGLWKNCVYQVHIKMQCKYYDTVLALPPVLEVSRGLMCVAVILSVIGFLLTITGMKCTRCVGDNNRVRSIILLAAGSIFIISGILVLIPVSWTAYNIIRDFYNPAIHAGHKRELGAALYLGWLSSALLIIGGALFCSFYRRGDKHRRGKYSSHACHGLPNSEYMETKAQTKHAYV
ncbi:claudin-8-like [Pelodiscus sinensis]|uniref:claudin-8-like n=1 Tax=Pelodiscus sinensis TaxID=13735 RepID=UPI0003C433AF|nr:claudin-8-like [Pelodiscus sinensis]|eukprot:XP_006126136.1 claudin-8-like [Pelodiscus sinensis]